MIKLSMRPLSHIPPWLKWGFLACCLLLPILMILQPYTRSAVQVQQIYKTALEHKDYKTAYAYLDQHYPGASYETFQHWIMQASDTSPQLRVHKVPILFDWIYIWRINIPTHTTTFRLPNPNMELSIDGIPYPIKTPTIQIPLFEGKHSISVAYNGLEAWRKEVTVTNSSVTQPISIAVLPTSNLSTTVKTFLVQYNQTWCQAFNLHSPDGILRFLTSKTSPEYTFLNSYIQEATQQDWVQDTESLKDLQITGIQIVNNTYVNATTKEVYHHSLRILKDHADWKRGDTKQYDTNISWTYRLKLTDPANIQIESLSPPNL